jgi:shikimate kinase
LFCRRILAMQLTLIAMSGTGKSYWAAKLADSGFSRFSCDNRIASKLAKALTKPDGTVMEMGEWMGLPYHSHYAKRESRYLNFEKEVLNEIIRTLETHHADMDSKRVVDTTGSVIYTGKDILEKLRKYTTVVHLATPPEIQEQLFRAYLAKPRPVLWRGKFVKKSDEKNEDALARCYPELLAYREALYKHYAHITIDYNTYRKKGFAVTDFLNEVDRKINPKEEP